MWIGDSHNTFFYLQGHKKDVYEALTKPMTNPELYAVLGHIPPSSIRRCLSEMKYANLVEKHGGQLWGKWRRLEDKI